ncbi:MAG: hypothetical protein V9G20_17105 [Candidatus Promineifilaceae bacterium]
MTNDTALPPELSPDDQVEFVAYHRPQLMAGDYVLEMGQTFNDLSPQLTGRFNVAGERFALQPGDVHATFPPAGSDGPYAHIFPHVILQRSTFPWERTPRGDGADDVLAPPWLALLLFDAAAAPELRVVKASDLIPRVETTTASRWPGLELEVSQDPEERAMVMDLPWSQLKSILPTYEELSWTTHTRRIVYANANTPPTEVAVVFSLARPPQKGRCVVHLVSLEERFKPGTGSPAPEPDDLILPDGPFLTLLQSVNQQLNQVIKTNPLADDEAADSRAFAVELRGQADGKLELLTPMPTLAPAFTTPLALLTPLPDEEALLADVGKVKIRKTTRKGRNARGRIVDHLEIALHLPEPLRTVSQNDLKGTKTTGALRGWFQEKWAAGPLVIAPKLKPDAAAPQAPAPPFSSDTLTQIQVDAIGRALMPAATFSNWQTGQNVTGSFFTDLDDGTSLFVTYQGAGTKTWRSLTFYFTPCLGLDSGLTQWLLTVQKAGCRYVELVENEVALPFTATPQTQTLRVDQPLVNTLFGDQDGWTRLQERGDIQTRRVLRLNNELRSLEITLQQDFPGSGITARIRLRPQQRLTFDAQGASDEQKIQLISLYHWEFASDPDSLDFVKTIQNLDGVRQQENGSAHDVALRLDTTVITAPAVKAYLQAGYVPLPHALREGDQTVSWYRGPLIPRLPTANDYRTLPLPARTADELLIFDPNVGMFSVAYASAWELGRTLALADKQFSLGLYHWKRAHAQELTRLQQELDRTYVPQLRPQTADTTFPPELAAFLDRLTRLQGVPFSYLVPQEALLPVESIRFFSVDPLWLECLRDGALSLGRVLAGDQAHDANHWDELPAPPHLSGFLLRSAAIAAFPHTGADASLPLLRLERLSADILFGLYAGEEDLTWLSVHLPPQVLHFGLKEGAGDTWSKQMRNPADGGRVTFLTHNPNLPDDRIQQVVMTRQDMARLAAAGVKTTPLLTWLQAEKLLQPWPVAPAPAPSDGKPPTAALLAQAIRPALLREMGGAYNEAYTPKIAAHVQTKDGQLWLEPAQLAALSQDKLPDTAILSLALTMMTNPFILSSEQAREAFITRLKGHGFDDKACQQAWQLADKRVYELDLQIGASFWRPGSNILNLLHLARDLADRTRPVCPGLFTAAELGLQMLAAPPQLQIKLV